MIYGSVSTCTCMWHCSSVLFFQSLSPAREQQSVYGSSLHNFWIVKKNSTTMAWMCFTRYYGNKKNESIIFCGAHAEVTFPHAIGLCPGYYRPQCRFLYTWNMLATLMDKTLAVDMYPSLKPENDLGMFSGYIRSGGCRISMKLPPACYVYKFVSNRKRD